MFERLGTQNFEQVLSRLQVAGEVARALQIDDAPFRVHYLAVRDSLAAAVHHVHIPWDNASSDALSQIAATLSGFERVYTTNYDILIYWAAMLWNSQDHGHTFKDFFWTQGDEETTEFDVANTVLWGNVTGVLYLHGALHLVRTIEGATYKVCNHEGTRVLDRFGQPILDGAVPLVVTEGGSLSKLASIEQSSYLSFGLAAFARDERDLVALGHSLGESDQHLVDVIAPNPYRIRNVGIGIHQVGGDVAQQMERFLALLPNARVFFFDAETHPLADPTLLQAPLPHFGVNFDLDELSF